MKFFSALLLSLTIFLIFHSPLFAAGFQLTQIGTLDTTGYQYGEWWYASPNPTLSGTTEAGATIEANIDGTSQTITADASGHWSTPTTIAEGDHQVILSSASGTYAFTIHIAQTMPAGVGTPSASTQPVAGNTTTTIFMLILGTAFLGVGVKLAYSQA